MRLPDFLKGHLTQKDLLAVKQTIAKAEKRTAGEIRVRVVNHCNPKFKNNPYKQAVHDFHHEGLHKTRDKTGVLILLVMGERKMVILGDSGINARVSKTYWQGLVNHMVGHFKRGNFRNGLTAIVKMVGKKLANHFPRKSDDRNELKDDVVVGGGR